MEVDEEEEFVDEYAFYSDCLFNGVDKIITPNFQEAQYLLNRKLERVKKALERKERQKDVLLKQGPKWDEARKLFQKKELTLDRNEDRVILDNIREVRRLYPNIHTFYENLDEEVTSVSVCAQCVLRRMGGCCISISLILDQGYYQPEVSRI